MDPELAKAALASSDLVVSPAMYARLVRAAAGGEALDGETDQGLEAAYPADSGQFAWRWNRWPSERRALLLELVGSGHDVASFVQAWNGLDTDDRDEWVRDAVRAMEQRHRLTESAHLN